MLKVKKYKGCEIHYTRARYRYDLYDDEHRWINSVNTLKEAQETIKNLIWTREHLPF